MVSAKIMFTGGAGEMLAAKLDTPPPEKIRAYALFAHCFTCSKDLKAVNYIAEALKDEGIALFRFDFTGLGSSGGEFENTNFSSNVQDLIAAANYMKHNLRVPDLMIGHSLGGAATIVAANSLPGVKAVATIGSPFDTENVLKHFHCSLDRIAEDGEAEVELSGRKFTIKQQFVDDVKSQNISEYIANLNKPILVMHSPIDETVNIEHARKIYETAKHPKSFISLDKADHLLLRRASDGRYVAKVLAAWSSQYVR